MNIIDSIVHRVTGTTVGITLDGVNGDTLWLNAGMSKDDIRLYHPFTAAIGLGMSFDSINRIFLPINWITVDNAEAIVYTYVDYNEMIFGLGYNPLYAPDELVRLELDLDVVYRELCVAYEAADPGLQGYVAREAQRMQSIWDDADNDVVEIVEDPIRQWAVEQLNGEVVVGWAELRIGYQYAYLEAEVKDNQLDVDQCRFQAFRWDSPYRDALFDEINQQYAGYRLLKQWEETLKLGEDDLLFIPDNYTPPSEYAVAFPFEREE